MKHTGFFSSAAEAETALKTENTGAEQEIRGFFHRKGIWHTADVQGGVLPLKDG